VSSTIKMAREKAKPGQLSAKAFQVENVTRTNDRARVAKELGVGKGELELAVTLRRIQETQLKGSLV
jgi:hypothetical protein